MSSIAVETNTSVEDAVRGINSSLQCIADTLPTYVKQGSVGDRHILCSTQEAELRADYAGSHTDPTQRAIMCYMVRVGVRLGDDAEEVVNTYALSYATMQTVGSLDALTCLAPEDIGRYGTSIDQLTLAVTSVHQEFARMHGLQLPETAAVAALDTRLVA